MSIGNDYPDRLQLSDARGAAFEYVRARAWIALHGSPATLPPGAQLLLEDGTIGVYPSSTELPAAHELIVGAVYAPAGATTSATLAVPTGRVLVRFANGPAAARAKELAQAGFRIEETLGYAPEAAWLQAVDGGIASALRGLSRLASVAGVVHVEPQLIRAAARR